MSLSVDNLRCFLEAARLLNFRAAARAVALSPAALGQRIKKLEDELGEPLFHRTTRTVVADRGGPLLLPYAAAGARRRRGLPRARRAARRPARRSSSCSARVTSSACRWVVPMLDAAARARTPGSPCTSTSAPARICSLRVRSADDRLRRDLDAADRSEARLAQASTKSATPSSARASCSASSRSRAPGRRATHPARHQRGAAALSLLARRAAAASTACASSAIIRLGSVQAISHFVLAGRGVAVLPEYFVAPT